MSSTNYKIRLPSAVLKYKNVPSNILYAKILDSKKSSTERSRICTSTISTYEPRQTTLTTKTCNSMNNTLLPSIQNHLKKAPIYQKGEHKTLDILIPFSLTEESTHNKVITNVTKSFILKYPKKVISNIISEKIKAEKKIKRFKHITHTKTKRVNLQLPMTSFRFKYKDELYDRINALDFQHDQLHRRVREALFNDINPMIVFEAYNDPFFKRKENRVNFLEDIYLVPHLKNTFNLKGKDANTKILNANCITKQICMSMNRERRQKIYLDDQKRIKNFYNVVLKTVKTHQKKNQRLEEGVLIEESFAKNSIYKNVRFASERVKSICFSKKFNKE